VRVLLINQFFHPDICATAQMATDLAEDLAAKGHEVAALATNGTYLGGSARLPRLQIHRGVRILRVRAASMGKRTTFARLTDYASYYMAAGARALLETTPDVTICMSTPPLIAAIGASMRLRGSRFVYWVQDLYPDIGVALGAMRENAPATRVLRTVSGKVLNAADAVVAVGAPMAARIASTGVAPGRIHVIPNWADGNAIRPIASTHNAFRKEHGLEGAVVMYSGNMGRAHDFQTLLDITRAMRGEDVTFAFVGDGARRGDVEALARHDRRVRVLPYQERSRLAESLSAGDVHLISQAASTAGLVEPSKLYGILAAGRPTLYVGPPNSEVAQTIQRERVGAVIANGDVGGAVRALRALIADAAPLGARAREAFDRGFRREKRTAAFEAVLRQVVERRMLPARLPAPQDRAA
jgi:glycosyltransferase involved in cell wall biosynthesis